MENTETPNTYCSHCRSCLTENARCSACGFKVPIDGWPALPSPVYPYLGKKLGGRYRVEQFVGRGATAEVYRVRSSSSRSFAAKIIKVSAEKSESFDENLHRLHLEINTLGRLRNPHVVNVLDLVELGHDTFAIVMDYIRGSTLGDCLSVSATLTLEQTLDIVKQVANGLHEVHLHGIVHRDIKPANIMLEKLPGAAGVFVRVVDFGLARSIGDVFRTQGFVGTPLYAAPEQVYVSADIEQISTRLVR